jgi:mRNA-degrading endonuclease toxin of MazEF toxin-antitoxin module
MYRTPATWSGWISIPKPAMNSPDDDLRLCSPRFISIENPPLAFACPISSKVKGYRFHVVLPPGLPVHGAVLCEHTRSLDWRIRGVTFLGRMPDAVLAQVREAIRTLAGIPH